MPAEDKFFFSEYSRLVGKRVKRVVKENPRGPRAPTPDNYSSYNRTVFGLEFDDGTTAWIMCDSEGNGPGFLSIGKGDMS